MIMSAILNSILLLDLVIFLKNNSHCAAFYVFFWSESGCHIIIKYCGFLTSTVFTRIHVAALIK